MSARTLSAPDNSMQIWTPAAGWDCARRGRSVTGERGGHKMNTKTVERRGSLLHLEGAKLRWGFSGKTRSGPKSDPIKARRTLAPVLGLPGPAMDRAAPSGFVIVVVGAEPKALYELRKCSNSELLSVHYLVSVKERNGHTVVIRATLGSRFLGPES